MAGADAQARMMERLLDDPAFRARFRRDPVAVAREEGVDELADELSVAGNDPMQTLDFRESRSSVAGVMMAAAVEGMGIYELGRQLLPHVEAAQAAAGNLPPQNGVAQGAGGSGAGVQYLDDNGDSSDGEGSDGGDSGDDGGDSGDDGEDSGDDGSDNWDETHESGSPEDSGGSGDDGSSESGSDEDSGGSGDDGSDGSSDSDSDVGDSGSDSAPGADGLLQMPDVSGQYPGDNASPAQVAEWMGSAAQKRGLPPELPVMAALVESGMKNLPGGDADSVGFFQMRVGTWNQGAYSGYPDHPELQLKWFLDHAAAVKKDRLAHGLPVNDPKQYGNWIADVERPAAQYRGRYQQHLDQAQELLKKAGGKHRAGEGAMEFVDGGGQHAGRRALTALSDAKKYLGTPYRWGGSSPKTGFDCSGLVQWAYAKAGIRIPRVTDQQILAANGTPVSRRHLLPGDLVFFRDSTGYVHHVGISLGGNKFVHAPHTGDVVKVSSLKEPYYAQQFTGGRRFDRAVTGGGEGRQVQAASEAPQRLRSSEAEAAQLARAALDRDAAEVQRSNSALFKALMKQERSDPNEVQFLKALDPSQ